MPTLTQGQQYAGATVKYDAQTGQPLTQGATTTLPTTTQPLVNAPISTSSLQQVQQPLEVVQPKIEPAPAFPTLQLTQAETNTQAQSGDISSQIAALTGSLSGQEAYTTQQQQEKDIIGKQSAVQSYSNQLKQLEQEAKGINLRLGLDNEKGLIEASSQGLTKGVYNAQSRGRAQEANRQLLENSNKAYSVGALAAQAQGDLTTALNYVDQAVKSKYQPIEARYKAEQANLENIKNSPDYTSAQKKQALNMEAELKAKQDAVAVQKDNTKTIQGLALQASENNAPPAIVSAIMNSPDVISAGIQGRGWTKKETAQSIQEYNFAVRGGYKGSFSQYQNEDANRKAVVARAGAARDGSGIPLQTLSKVQTVSGQFDGEQVVKDYNTISQQVEAVRNAGVTPTDDIQRIYSFAKVMDPNSVVREGEYKTVQDYSTAVLQRFGLNANRVFNNDGFLTAEARKFLLDTLNKRLAVTEKSYKNIADEYGRRINKITGQVDGKEYITDYSKGYSGNTNNNTGGVLASTPDEAIKASGQTYTQIIDKYTKAFPGDVVVFNKKTGQFGAVPKSEANDINYIRM